jgi:hypothetical protein
MGYPVHGRVLPHFFSRHMQLFDTVNTKNNSPYPQVSSRGIIFVPSIIEKKLRDFYLQTTVV